MSVATALWIVLILWGASLVGLVALIDRAARRRMSDERRRFQDEIERRFDR